MSGILYPTRLRMRAFRSFKDETVLNFPPKGAVLIRGKYDGSEVSSGSGKSTIGLAMSYCMGFCPIPATRLKNWYAPKGFLCELTLTDGENQYVILRDPKLTLTITGKDNKTLEGTAAESELARAIRIAPYLAETLTYREQRKPGKFITSTDSDKKEFGSALLGLKEVEAAYDEKLSEISTTKTRIENHTREIESAKAYHRDNQVDPVQFETAKKNYEEARARVQSLSSKEKQNELTIRYNRIVGEINLANQAVNAGRNAENETARIRERVVAIHNEILVLQASKCPTCKRGWDQYHDELKAKEAEKESLLARMKVNMEISKNSETVATSVKPLTEEAQGIYKQISELNSPLSDAMRTLEATTTTLSTLAQKASTAQKWLDASISKTAELKISERELLVLEHTAAVIGRNGFLGNIFDEFLYDVEIKTNDMISCVPNLTGFALSMSSTTVNKNGNVKKSISTVVYRDGREIAVADLSGGQAECLEGFCDLAVRQAVQKRSGSPLGWIFLDETMSSLCNETKSFALEVIKTKVDGLIFVVDHSNVIQEGFESVVSIEFDGKNSRVVG